MLLIDSVKHFPFANIDFVLLTTVRLCEDHMKISTIN